MKVSKSEKERGTTRARACNEREERKNRGLKGRITSGILVSAFHLDEKPISPILPSFARREPPLELDVHCASTDTRAREVDLTLLPRLRDVAY